MKRCLLVSAIFLLAGAVANVAVAWGCWLGSDRVPDATLGAMRFLPDTEALRIAEDLGFSPQISPDGFPIVAASGMTIRCGFDTTLDLVQISQFETLEQTYVGTVSDLSPQIASFSHVAARRVQAGWPTQTMRGYEITVTDDEAGGGVASLAFVVREGVPPFPLLPIWPAFAVSSLQYGGVLWLMICGPFVPRRVIRAIRAKRGRCPKCAYPVGASAVCSECYHPLPRPSHA